MFSHRTSWRRRAIVAFALFVISLLLLLEDARYLFFGLDTDAQIVSVTGTTRAARRGFTPKSVLIVKYRFSEVDGVQRSEEETVPISWQEPTPGSDGQSYIRVRYLPGIRGSSRLYTTENRLMPVVRVSVSGFLAVIVVHSLYKHRKYKRYLAMREMDLQSEHERLP